MSHVKHGKICREKFNYFNRRSGVTLNLVLLCEFFFCLVHIKGDKLWQLWRNDFRSIESGVTHSDNMSSGQTGW